MEYRKTTLLTVNNHKTIKGEKKGYRTYIMYLAPFTQNSLGKNLCPMASKGCSAACLFNSGMGGMYAQVKNGRINKTEWFLANRKEFLETLDSELTTIQRRAENSNFIPIIRLNGTSDISWESFKVRDGKNLFELYPEIQFYDYTKNYLRFNKILPNNYHLTFSRSEKNHDKAMELLAKGVNVAIVFNKVPVKYEGYEVIVGDNDDLRFKDPKGVIVGLKYKNSTGKNADNKIAFSTGFAITV
jgi:hypothetical protein